MAAPVATAAPAAAQAATSAASSSRVRRGCLVVVLLGLATPVLIIGLIVLLLGGAASTSCSSTAPTTPGTSPAGDTGTPVGPLGGIGDTGITAADLAAVRASGGANDTITEGSFVTTAYGPPWTGINGAGVSTAGGLRLNGGNPRKYFVAASPSVEGLGRWIYIWPNPFGWRGAFLVADTGSAIQGRRIDFYDWRGRETQLGWGRQTATVTRKPTDPSAPTPSDNGGSTVADSPGCASTIVGGSGAGKKAVQLAVALLGKDGRTQPFPGFQPPTFNDSWCAWFITNLWRLAGVDITTNAGSNYPYLWAKAKHPNLILKEPGQRAKTLKLPPGTALMYGIGPQNLKASVHVNMVRALNSDGTIQYIGGNQGTPGRVTTHGPCKITNGASVYLSGPGCDSRPIYAIVLPSLDSDDGDGGESPPDQKGGTK